MGCLPILLLFPLGFGIGYLIDGNAGALWGSGAGFGVGFLLMVLFVRALRGRR